MNGQRIKTRRVVLTARVYAGWLAGAVVVLFFSISVAYGQTGRVYIDITSPTFQRIPLIVSEFHRQKHNKLPPDETLLWFSSEMSRLLSITGIFNILEPGRLAKDTAKTPADSLKFAGWRLAGAEFLVSGLFQQTGAELVVELRLHDLITGELLVGRRYSGSPEDRSLMTRRFAGEVLAHFTGDGSVFDSRIAFISRKGMNSSISLVNFDGTDLTRLIDSPTLLMAPRWSPDGKTMAFVSFHENNPNMYFRSLAGPGAARLVSSFPGINLPGNWSPDGRSILMTLSIDGNEEIYNLNLANKQLTRLTNHFAIDVSPSVSPDGRRIAFVSSRPGSPQIYTMDADGTNVRRLTFQGNYNTSPVWSPRGGKIAFEGRIDGRFQIFVVDEEGLNPVQLTSTGSNENPSWSPDGQYIAFTARRDGRSRIFVMNANGTNPRLLVDGDNHFSPAWSPSLR